MEAAVSSKKAIADVEHKNKLLRSKSVDHVDINTFDADQYRLGEILFKFKNQNARLNKVSQSQEQSERGKLSVVRDVHTSQNLRDHIEQYIVKSTKYRFLTDKGIPVLDPLTEMHFKQARLQSAKKSAQKKRRMTVSV